MKLLWAPWRVKFIRQKKQKTCIFCNKIRQKNDKKNFVVYRGKHNFVVLNLYPYTNAHLMVVPNRHVGDLELLSKDELYELFDLVRQMVKILKKTHKICCVFFKSRSCIVNILCFSIAFIWS